jgi:hypothetical protein
MKVKFLAAGIFLLLILSLCSGRVIAHSRKKKPSKAFEQMLEIFREQPVVEAGSKMPVKEILAPYSVSVISRKDIKTYQPLNFGELLQRIPGVNVVPFNDGLNWVDIRGLIDSTVDQTRTVFLIDGIPMWANLAGINIADDLPVDFQDIKNIEVVRTPTTVSGANDDEGLIAITTESPAKTTGVRVSAGIGSQGTYTEFLSYGGKVGGFSYRVDSSNYNSDVWRPSFFDSSNMIPQPLNPYNQDWKLSSQMRYSWKNSQVNVLFGRSYSKGSYEYSVPFSVLFNAQNDFLAGDYIHRFGKKSQLTVYASHNQLTGDFVTQYFLTLPSAFAQEGRDQIGFNDYFSWGGHETLTYGADLYNLNIGTSVDPDYATPFLIPPTKSQLGFYLKPFTGTGWDIYFQNKSGLTRKDWLYYGARYDKDWSGESGFAPFISYVHRVTVGTALRANVNVSYRFPDVSEDYFDFTPTGTFTFPPLAPYPFVSDTYGSVTSTGQMVNPEKVTDYELSYGGFFTPHFKARAEFYLKNNNSYITRQGFLVSPLDCVNPATASLCAEYPPFAVPAVGGPLSPLTVPLPIAPGVIVPATPVIADVRIPQNMPNVQEAGAELSMDYKLAKDFYAYGNYRNQTITMQYFPSQAALLGVPVISKQDASPQAISTIGIKYEGKKWSGFVELYSFSHMDLHDIGTDFFVNGSNQINLGIETPLWKQVSLGLASYDVFNAPVYIPWSGVTIGGRFQMTVQYRF